MVRTLRQPDVTALATCSPKEFSFERQGADHGVLTCGALTPAGHYRPGT